METIIYKLFDKAIKQAEQLQAELEFIKSEYGNCPDDKLSPKAREMKYKSNLIAENKKLREYVQHLGDCDITKYAGKITQDEIESLIDLQEWQGHKCTCGLDALKGDTE